MFTKEQANLECAQYRYLIGNHISKGLRITGVIEEVIVAPLDGINQHKFLNEYKKSGDAQTALQSYKGNLFTVLLTARSRVNKNEVFTLELERYLADHPEQELQAYN